MNIFKKILVAGAFTSSLIACSNNPSVAVDTLESVISQHWQVNLNHSPSLAAAFGDKDAKGKLDDVSAAALESKVQAYTIIRDKLIKLGVQTDNSAEINRQILLRQVQNEIDSYYFNMHQVPIMAEGGFHSYLAGMGRSTDIKNQQDFDNYLKKITQVKPYFEQQIAWMKQGLATGNTLPKAVLAGVEDGISIFITEAHKSVYYSPLNRLPDSIDKATQEQWQTQTIAAINSHVIPAYLAFYDFMVNDYQLNARESLAAYDLPNGKAFYHNRIKFYTTLDLTPDQVHQMGLKEVARIRKEMEQVIQQTGFTGNFSEFLQFLRNDPQFYPKSAAELLKEAAFIAKKADAQMPKFFAKLPRQTYGIKEVPAELAPKYTTGRYSGSNREDRAGYYWVNTYALDKRPLYEMEALTLHEAVPGHHLQIALNKELDNLQNFRRYGYISAFGEGWGLYAEYLGLEMGFYKDPYSNFGRLTYEMWRAARLVIDTGIHAKGWSRQQAIDFMAKNTALSLHNVTTEIDRYISWPGQALSYKIGEMTIKRLRKQAEVELADKFDIRQFHQVILEQGSVPLNVLEKQVQQYIKEQLDD
ncbi:DUF885 family protein [Paraferrimonas sp. SM1919]|uniref:DUF885 domain-containing protein n=1 Tax=Paraferrimonas sp. SM1919 TaxID=2662263 RepID=UPI0013D1021F|nr:DUF885 domain-containing protein [Paraferrimonas sp. SM1919]